MSAPDNPYDTSSVPRGNDSLQSHGRKQLLGCFIGAGLPVLLLGFAIYIAARPAVDRQQLSKINVGMSMSQVSRVLGQPNHKYGEFDWRYWRWGNSGWVEIAFDNSGHVEYVNDESAFR